MLCSNGLIIFWYGLIWLWGHKRSSAQVQVRAGVTWPGLQRGQQDVARSLAGPTWCFTARKPLFLRRGAPRPLTESGLGTGWRGASPPANPYFFVVEHHAIGPSRAFGGAGVVLHCPLALVSSSRGTTSDGRIRARGRLAWCLTSRKPLFLRRRAPRHWPWSSLRRSRRGASLPASPCFFVEGHHAHDFLQPDNSGNPPRVPGIPISPKKRKMSARCCSRSTLPTFPFPLSISRDCPSLHIEGTVSILSYPILS